MDMWAAAYSAAVIAVAVGQGQSLLPQARAEGCPLAEAEANPAMQQNVTATARSACLATCMLLPEKACALPHRSKGKHLLAAIQSGHALHDRQSACARQPKADHQPASELHQSCMLLCLHKHAV